jgi:FtsH-binding integral membrane protein
MSMPSYFQQSYQTASTRYKSSLDAFLYSIQNSMSPYPKHVAIHLSRVYGTIAVLTMITVLGVLTNMTYHIGGMITQILSFGTSMYLIMTSDRLTPLTPRTFMNRASVLALNAFLIGCSLSPLIAHAVRINPSILISAITLSASSFVFLSLSALFAKRRTFFVLGSLISSSIGLLAMYSLLSFFFPSTFSFSIQIYGGLLIVCATILYSTQLIAERAAMCDSTILQTTLFLDNAMLLFWDLINLFVRILIILLDSEKKQKKKDDERRNR